VQQCQSADYFEVGTSTCRNRLPGLWVIGIILETLAGLWVIGIILKTLAGLWVIGIVPKTLAGPLSSRHHPQNSSRAVG
jgi:hypothetical protein